MKELYQSINQIRDYLNFIGVELPDDIKARDPREPAREEKEIMEDKMGRLIKQRFRGQKKKIKESLRWWLPQKTNVDTLISQVPDLSDPENEKKLFTLWMDGLNNGREIVEEEIGFFVNYEQFNETAAFFARSYVTEWTNGLDIHTLNGLRDGLQNFIETSGYDMGDLMEHMGRYFSEERVRRIVVTEVTRMYGKAAALTASTAADEFPKLKITKRWFTNYDDKVCPICSYIHGMVVFHDEYFVDKDGIEYDYPPAHVNCRCWMRTQTQFDPDYELPEHEPYTELTPPPPPPIPTAVKDER